MNKFGIAAIALAAATLVSGTAFAQSKEGPWLVRARAVSLQSANGDTTGLGLSVNDKIIPEVDITYFLSPNLAVELILTIPQEHELKSKGAKIGTVSHLPPTLLAQYHFGGATFKPYVGAGVNFTKFTAVDLVPALAGVDITRNSWGFALQAGFDVPVTKQVSINVDVKKAYIKTDVLAGGNSLGTFSVDPLLIGVGVGYRF
jgi:outer membrane protein